MLRTLNWNNYWYFVCLYALMEFNFVFQVTAYEHTNNEQNMSMIELKSHWNVLSTIEHFLETENEKHKVSRNCQ